MAEEISSQEFIQMAARCRDEIKELRARVERLQPKADAYDNLAAVLRLLPQPPHTMGEDLVWRLDKRIAELKAPSAPELTGENA